MKVILCGPSASTHLELAVCLLKAHMVGLCSEIGDFRGIRIFQGWEIVAISNFKWLVNKNIVAVFLCNHSTLSKESGYTRKPVL